MVCDEFRDCFNEVCARRPKGLIRPSIAEMDAKSTRRDFPSNFPSNSSERPAGG